MQFKTSIIGSLRRCPPNRDSRTSFFLLDQPDQTEEPLSHMRTNNYGDARANGQLRVWATASGCQSQPASSSANPTSSAYLQYPPAGVRATGAGRARRAVAGRAVHPDDVYRGRVHAGS
ncbi:hypothetical protein DL765_006705 [Monosporascus sp. GIB2]|nr:hypothetical protein DL765_006705 [Monosporascus sp. GIB2]